MKNPVWHLDIYYQRREFAGCRSYLRYQGWCTKSWVGAKNNMMACSVIQSISYGNEEIDVDPMITYPMSEMGS